MSLENRVSIEVSPEDQQAIEGALDTLRATLQPYLQSLTVQDRRELPKMSDGTLPFVSKAVEYAETNAGFVPAFVNVAELKKDLAAVDNLTQFLRRVEEIHTLLDDTIVLAGSEAYVAALAFYNSIKLGVRMNIPGAKAIYEDLKQRFAKSASSPEPQS